jgi:nucleotide-binding universal stress UspA family protein
MLAIRTILHPTDFSEHAARAFKLACTLAREHGARLIVLHVATSPPIVLPDGVVSDYNVDDYLAGLRAELKRVQASDSAIGVEHRLEQGDPATEIIRVATDVNADCIVVGSHGRTGLLRLLLGSVAEQVMRKAPCPVLTVKADRSGPEIRHVLHPTDFSERSRFAFDFACSLARDYRAQLIVLHVMPVPLVQEKRDYREEMSGLLDRMEAPDPRVRVERRLEQGDPAPQILRVAEETGSDLIVMGTHGRTALSRLTMGSVAEEVVRQAHCAVMTLKVPFSEGVPVTKESPQAVEAAV